MVVEVYELEGEPWIMLFRWHWDISRFQTCSHMEVFGPGGGSEPL